MSESQTSVKLPIFDISRPLSSSSLNSLSLACKEWGFFHIRNHGVPKDLCQQLHFLSNQIFSLPSDVKLNAGPFSNIKTYTPHFIASPFFESLRVSGPDFFSSAQNTCQALINQPIPEFSGIATLVQGWSIESPLPENYIVHSHAIEVYGSKMEKLSRKILEVILMSLGPEFELKFASEFKNCHGYLRVNNYSPPEYTKNVHEDVEGLGMHTDMSCITIVYQDEIGGLQVRSNEGKWMNIDPCQDTLVVNVGDLLQAWSNGNLRSSEHRVVLKEPLSRFSIAFFWCFEDEKLIVAPQEIVGNETLRVYNPFVCADYLKFRESNEKGKFEKVGFTVKHFAGK